MGAFCGNGRIDKGETCDGGWNTKNNLDPCCTDDCQLRMGKQCRYVSSQRVGEMGAFYGNGRIDKV